MEKPKGINIKNEDGNVLADMELPDAKAHLLKSELVTRIDKIIRERVLDQVETVKRFGLSQSDVSRLLGGNFEEFSMERLLGLLTASGCEVKIFIREPHSQTEGKWQKVAQRIKAREKELLELIELVFRTDDGNLFPADLIAAGAVQRSLMVLNGFLSMLGAGNYLCGGALLRMQIDTILRLYATSLFPSGEDTFMAFLADRPLSNLKAPDDDNPLTDRELVTRVGKLYPWVPDVYRRTSGFIHFSLSALMSSVSDLPSNGLNKLQIGTQRGRPWTPEERLEAAEAFDAAKGILDMIYAWGHAKNSVAVQREAKKDGADNEARNRTRL